MRIKTIIKKLTGEQLIEACSMVMEGPRPNMAHIREVTNEKPTATLEFIFLTHCWDALKDGSGKGLVKMFTESHREWKAKVEADPKADPEYYDAETIATYALADLVSAISHGWEIAWQKDYATPRHIDDRAPGLVVPDTAYATQEEIIDMANNSQLKVQAKN